MVKYFIYLLVAQSVVNNCFCNTQFNQIKQEQKDVISKVIEINVSSNNLTLGMTSIDVFDFYQDTLFLINKDKLVQVNLKKGEINTNLKINVFLSKQVKANKHAQQILVQDDSYYITIWNECYRLSKNGEVKKLYTNDIMISRIDVVGSTILIADQESIKTIDQNGKIVYSKPFENFGGNNGFITSKSAITYQAVPTDNIIEFKIANDLQVELKEFAPLSVEGVKEPYVCYSDNNNIVVFDYWKRTAIYVLKKGIKQNTVLKKINLAGINYIPTGDEIKKEEGNPNFKISYHKQMYYIITLRHGKLNVNSFIL